MEYLKHCADNPVYLHNACLYCICLHVCNLYLRLHGLLCTKSDLNPMLLTIHNGNQLIF